MELRARADSRTDRIDAIQWFRAIAVLLVIALHSIELVKFRHQQLGEPLGYLSAPTFYDQFGASGVDLFFVMSGFVMAHLLERVPQGHWKPFLIARVRRILPLYWLATLAMAALLLVLKLPIATNSVLVSLTVWPLPGHAMLDAPVLVVGWSLAFELAFYAALIPAIFAPVRSRRLIVLLIVTTLAAGGQLSRPSDNLLALFLNPIWYEFAFGLLVHMWWRHGLDDLLVRIVSVVGGVLLVGGVIVWIVPETRPFAIYDDGAGLDRALYWALPWAGILAWALTVTRRGWVSRVLLRIGDASYALYLTHMLVTTALLKLLPVSSVPPDLLPLISLAIALVLGVAAHDHVERPLLLYLRGARQLPSLPASV